VSSYRAMQSGGARFACTTLTFLLVTLSWVLFRAESFSDARSMFGYLFPMTLSDFTSSLSRFWDAQFANGSELMRLTLWFKPRELWPQILPPDYLSTSARPAGLLLIALLLATFLLPNTHQILSRLEATGDFSAGPGAVSRTDQLSPWLAATVAGMFVFSVLKLSHVSPFLYFQF